MSTSAVLDHYRWQACSRQWRGFVRAMGEEFAEALPAAELSRLMARMGERFAAGHPLPVCADLPSLQQACNTVWEASDWGQAQFVEHSAHISIDHLGAPLEAALGDGADWASGFLQGVYRAWFRGAGMLPALDVRPVPGTPPDLQRFLLSRVK